MAILLSQASAFNLGHDLWILPDREQSRWTHRLDWYLNFQIARSTKYQAPPRSLVLKDILKKTQLPEINCGWKNSESAEVPLLIATGSLLPNQWVVILPFQNDLQKWTGQIAKVWEGLQTPSLRIFLPNAMAPHVFDEAWQTKSQFQDYTCVTD